MFTLFDQETISFSGIYAVWLLVPLIPAIIIYLLFPQAGAETSWKIFGIALKATGAAGFYMGLVAIAYYNYMQPAINHINESHPYWTIEAPVKFLDSDGKEIVPWSRRERFFVEPYANEYKKIDFTRYMVTLRLAETKPPHRVSLMFSEGEGFIALDKYFNDTQYAKYIDRSGKRIDLSSEAPFEIRAIKADGQNQPSVAGVPKRFDQLLETNTRGSR